MTNSVGYICLPFAVVCVLFFSAYGEEQKHWALLVAGSNGYMNYRHQADICHAYHIVRNHGIPDEQIVVMMFDDIAYNDENPFPGNIINYPNGTNVYPGVLKDYTKDDVTPDVFLKVLSGDEEGVEKLLGRKGKVIKSGPNDTVFVNFADHGAPGLIVFPSDYLYAHDLLKVVKKMHDNNQYKHMVFYVEACESGSMFQRILPRDINVFATTAANPDESSYACYYDEKRDTYLGDVYSVNWMEDSSIENLSHESLQRQFKIVKAKTNTSHVREYGEFSMKKEKVGEFQGEQPDNSLLFRPENEKKHDPNADSIASEHVQLEILRRKMLAAKGEEKHLHENAYQTLKDKRDQTKKFFEDIVIFTTDDSYDNIHGRPIDSIDFDCYTKCISLLRDSCPGLDIFQNDYALRNFRVLSNLCEMDFPNEQIFAAIKVASLQAPVCEIN